MNEYYVIDPTFCRKTCSVLINGYDNSGCNAVPMGQLCHLKHQIADTLYLILDC